MAFNSKKFLEINPPDSVAVLIKMAMTADPHPAPVETLCMYAHMYTYFKENHPAADALYKASLYILEQCEATEEVVTLKRNLQKDYSNLLREMGRDEDALEMWPEEVEPATLN
jgi:hypothetical protein